MFGVGVGAHDTMSGVVEEQQQQQHSAPPVLNTPPVRFCAAFIFCFIFNVKRGIIYMIFCMRTYNVAFCILGGAGRGQHASHRDLRRDRRHLQEERIRGRQHRRVRLGRQPAALQGRWCGLAEQRPHHRDDQPEGANTLLFCQYFFCIFYVCVCRFLFRDFCDFCDFCCFCGFCDIFCNLL